MVFHPSSNVFCTHVFNLEPLRAEATCVANINCVYDAAAADSAPCEPDPKWTFVTLANMCPAEAGTIETFVNANSRSVATVAKEAGLSLTYPGFKVCSQWVKL